MMKDFVEDLFLLMKKVFLYSRKVYGPLETRGSLCTAVFFRYSTGQRKDDEA